MPDESLEVKLARKAKEWLTGKGDSGNEAAPDSVGNTTPMKHSGSKPEEKDDAQVDPKAHKSRKASKLENTDVDLLTPYFAASKIPSLVYPSVEWDSTSHSFIRPKEESEQYIKSILEDHERDKERTIMSEFKLNGKDHEGAFDILAAGSGSSKGTYLIDAKTGVLKKVSKQEKPLSWAPDGNGIVYVADYYTFGLRTSESKYLVVNASLDGQVNKLWEMNKSGSSGLQLVSSSGLQLVFSPSGKRVVVLDRGETFSNSPASLSVLDSAGKTRLQIRDTLPFASVYNLKWGIDDCITFVATEYSFRIRYGLRSEGEDNDRPPHMFLYDDTKGTLKDVGVGEYLNCTDTGIVFQQEDRIVHRSKRGKEKTIAQGSCPLVSPDGKLIAYVTADNKGISVLNNEGGVVSQVSGEVYNAGRNWIWSPDSTMLAYSGTSIPGSGMHHISGILDVALKQVVPILSKKELNLIGWRPAHGGE